MQRLGASRDSPNDALWDLDTIHGDEFLKLIQTGHILYLTAELGTEKSNMYTDKHTRTGTSDSAVKLTGLVSKKSTICLSFRSETKVVKLCSSGPINRRTTEFTLCEQHREAAQC